MTGKEALEKSRAENKKYKRKKTQWEIQKEVLRILKMVHPNPKPEPKTNGDRFRAMTDKELAEFLSAICNAVGDCRDCPFVGRCPETTEAEWWEKWLHLPMKEEAE